MTHRYDDIIGLPHPEPKKHKRMSIYDRAAQFAPFAALTGFDAVIRRTARANREQFEEPELDLEELLALEAQMENPE